MLIYELSLCLMCLVTAISAHSRIFPEEVQIPLLAVTTVLMLVHFVMTSWRWQMLPAWLVLLSALVLIIFNFHPAGMMQIITLTIACVFAALSAALIVGMPILKLPAPEGPHLIKPWRCAD